jgi:site-specific recombinase XerC
MIAVSSNDVTTLIRSTKPLAVRDRALLDLLYHSGLRISEALALRANDIEGNQITVRCGKGGKRRVITLANSYGHWEIWLAKRAATGEQFIFTTRTGEQLQTAHVRRLLATLGKLTGVKAHAHAFRHGHACRVYEATKDIAIVSKQLGHARISTTDTYLKGLPVDLGQIAALAF